MGERLRQFSERGYKGDDESYQAVRITGTFFQTNKIPAV